MKILVQGFCCILLILVSKHICADSSPLFQDDSILNAVLTAPLTQAFNERNKKQRLWMPGQLAYTDNAGNTQRHEVSIRTRGIFRRAECKFPPLRLNFKKKQLEDSLFDGQDKLKLVSPCSTRKSSQQGIILEYLAYKTLEMLTEDSLKARLIRLSYVDSDKRKKPWTHLTFVIEDTSALAKRTDNKLLKIPKIHSRQLNPEKTALVDIFQFLIANNDFSNIRGIDGTDCCHNVKLMSPNGAQTDIVPVPYDFDMSGLVDANYAFPPEKIPIKSVRKRFFRGRCKAPEIWDKTFEHFQAKRAEIIALYQNSSDLDDKHKNKTVKYIQEFYAILDNPKRSDNLITGRCRG